MTNYREILRLHSLGLNKTEIASSCQCARNTVAATLQRAANCGLQWPLPEEMSDKQLSERLFPSSTAKPVYKMPDYAYVHKELQRSVVTLNLLWLEEEICYVSLSSALLEGQPEPETLSQAVLALEQSLLSLESVEEVRFLVDGELADTYGPIDLP